MTENSTQLSATERRALSAAAHHLNPVVSISQKGLTPAVLTEIDRCLKAHELIKVRLYGIERELREALFAQIGTALHCHTVQHIGNLLVLWRPDPGKDSVPDRPPQHSAPATAKGRGATPITKKQAAERGQTRTR